MRICAQINNYRRGGRMGAYVKHEVFIGPYCTLMRRNDKQAKECHRVFERMQHDPRPQTVILLA
jgi:hypothetical protein